MGMTRRVMLPLPLGSTGGMRGEYTPWYEVHTPVPVNFRAALVEYLWALGSPPIVHRKAQAGVMPFIFDLGLKQGCHSGFGPVATNCFSTRSVAGF
jgi:hypothetical protein